MRLFKIVLFVLLYAILLMGCATTKGTTPQDKRHAILDMKKETLAELYRVRPQAKSQIAKAAEYAVFSDANINVIFASFGGGYGVVKNNKNGKHTYMKMGKLVLVWGWGSKIFELFLFFTIIIQ